MQYASSIDQLVYNLVGSVIDSNIVNPIKVGCNSGVDARVASGAINTEGDNSNHNVLIIHVWMTHHRTAWVVLKSEKKGVNTQRIFMQLEIQHTN